MFLNFRNRFRQIKNESDALLAFCIVGLICLLVIPLPAFLLDTLLSLNIVLSVMALLLTIYIENALEFNAFPSLLLFLTLFRLSLNISSTRMILTAGDAGDIIRTFGDFVTRGNTLVGLILFILLTVINFIVVSKGAGRIAEVAARFTLEALPGKQMAIDSELNSGLLTQEQSRKERSKLQAEAEFHGSMDGASKFVKGDAICSLIITFVNLVGGLTVGIIVKKLSPLECWQLFSQLTIGDGLVNQIPALLISIGAAMMVTRVSKETMGKSLGSQLFTHPKVIGIAGIVLFILSFIPGMPHLVMLTMSALIFGWSYLLFAKGKKQEQKKVVEVLKQERSFSTLSLGLGGALLEYAAPLQNKIPQIRSRIKEKLGVTIPSLEIFDFLELPSSHFVIKMKEATIFTGEAKELLEIVEQLYRTLESNAYELLTRQDVALLIEETRKIDSAVVEELIPAKINLGQILKVLQHLLKEKISIRDFVTLLESIADYFAEGKSFEIEMVTEHVRKRFSKHIVEQLFGKKRIAYAITFDPNVQQLLDLNAKKETLRPQVSEKIAKELKQFCEKAKNRGVEPVVITSNLSRVQIRKLIEKNLPGVPVLAFDELHNEISISNLGTVSNEVLI